MTTDVIEVVVTIEEPLPQVVVEIAEVGLVGPPASGGGSGNLNSVNGDEGPDVVLDAGDVGADPAGAAAAAASGAASALATHAGSHSVHGIADTTILETQAGAQGKANAAAAAVHDGLAAVATSGEYADLAHKPAIPSIAGLATSLSVAQADAIIQAAVDAVAANLAAHLAATDPHGARAYTDTKIAALIGGAPGIADTLGEIAAILAADEAGVASLTTAVNARLVAANNLADLTDKAAARTALQLAAVAATGSYTDLSNKPSIPVTIADLTETGTAKIMTAAERSAIAALGNAATRNVGTTAGTVAAGDDSRMTNSRMPLAHAASHATGGSDAIAPADIGAVPTTRSVAAGTGLTGGGALSADRSLAVAYGSTAGTAAQGDDTRLADARTPTAHKASHAVGGSDALSLTDIGAGTAATKDTGTASGQVPLLGAGGVLAIGRLATGTPTGSKFVRDDGTLAVPAGGSLENIPRRELQPTGTITATLDRFATNLGSIALTSGTSYYGLVRLTAGDVLTNFNWRIGSVATVTHQWCALLDSSRVVLCGSADDTTASPANSGNGRANAIVGGPYTVLSSGLFMVEFMIAAGAANIFGFSFNTAPVATVAPAGGPGATGQTTAPTVGTTRAAPTAAAGTIPWVWIT